MRTLLISFLLGFSLYLSACSEGENTEEQKEPPRREFLKQAEKSSKKPPVELDSTIGSHQETPQATEPASRVLN